MAEEPGAGTPAGPGDPADPGRRADPEDGPEDEVGPGGPARVARFDDVALTGAADRVADLGALSVAAGARPTVPPAGLDAAALGAAPPPARTADLTAPPGRRRSGRRADPRPDTGSTDRTTDRADRTDGRSRDGERAAAGAVVGGPAGSTARADRPSGRRRSVGERRRGTRTEQPDPAAAGVDPEGPASIVTARSDRTAGGRRGARRGSPGRPVPIDPDADPVAAAREICLRLLTDRARTRHELADALRRREVPDEVAEQVLGRFDQVGLIDDEAFAGQWVRSRHRFSGLGRRAIAMELRRKGVDDETAREALAEVDGDAEELRARQLVDKKLRTMRLDGPDARAVAVRRLVGMLARKGYGAGIAYGVVRTALAEHGAEPDELDGEPPPLDD